MKVDLVVLIPFIVSVLALIKYIRDMIIASNDMKHSLEELKESKKDTDKKFEALEKKISRIENKFDKVNENARDKYENLKEDVIKSNERLERKIDEINRDSKERDDEQNDLLKQNTLYLLKIAVLDESLPLTDRINAGEKYIKLGGNGFIKKKYNKLLEEYEKINQ